MHVELFTLCDAATEWMGKLNVLGTFDAVQARDVPTIHPHCAVALRLRFDRHERGDYRIRLNVIDADANLVVPPLDATLHARFADEMTSHAFNLVINLQRLKFDRFGEYAIDLTLDGKQVGTLPLFVRQRPEPTAG